MLSDSGSDLVRIMSQVAESLRAPADIDKTLQRITTIACEVIPGVEYASISVLHEDGRIDTVSPTIDFLLEVDRMQYEYHEGACYEAVTGEGFVRSEDVLHDPRWPRFGPRAAEYGIRAQTALQLWDNDRSGGALNLYSGEPGGLDGPGRIAEIFSTHAAVALGYASELGTLHQALATRKTIGQALGVVMERYSVDEERAFGYLVRVSQNGNVKVRDVAQKIVDDANQQTKKG